VAFVIEFFMGFLITLGGYRHLDGLEQRWIIEHKVVIIFGSDR
jgi:hypothetical protein